MTDLYDNMIARQKEVFTQKQQKQLRTTPVAVIGCGGLGGTVIEQFVRAGFEELTIVDQDVFDKTNLNRQVRSNINTIGKSKVEITKNYVQDINPKAKITSYDCTLDSSNITEILKQNKIVIDALDNVYTRVMLSRKAQKERMVFVHAAVDKTMGQLSVFEPDSQSYEELFKLKSCEKSLEESKEYLMALSSKKPQVLGVTPSIFAALEVNETIKYILGMDDVILAPKVLQWDLFDMTSFRIIEF